MKLHWLSPGDPNQRTGGYLYNRRMISELRGLGWSVQIPTLEGDWPWPTASQRQAAAAKLHALSSGVVVADGLCWTGLGDAAASLAARRPVVVLLHSPLHAEDGRPEVRAAERRALRGVWPVVTSPTTAQDLGIDAEVLIPGTDLVRLAPKTPREPLELLTVATLTRRKGHDILLHALSRLHRRDFILRCAGAPRDEAWARGLRGQARALGLEGQIRWMGDLEADALEAAYARAQVLVQPARYEAWGMALTEGMARGLAVISTPAGALQALDPAAWLRVAPGDPEALAGAVERLLSDGAERRRLAAAAIEAARGLPDWRTQAQRLAALLREAKHSGPQEDR